MNVIAFHLRGKMAHFRRYYSNSSALSYTVPPRTTIIGIIAGLLGYKRDSYYEKFSKDQCKVAVGLYSPVKKIVQKMNLLQVKSLNDLNGSKEHHSQCATEWVIPHNIVDGYIDYRVWFHHKDHIVMKELESLLNNSVGYYKSLGISLALGSAQNLGWIEYDDTYKIEKNITDDYVDINSIIPIDTLKDIDIKESSLFLIKEELPLEFDKKRRLTLDGKNKMIINNYATSIKAKVTEYYTSDNGDKIIWM